MSTGTLIIISLVLLIIPFLWGELSREGRPVHETSRKKAMRPGTPFLAADRTMVVPCRRAYAALMHEMSRICRKDENPEAAAFAPAMERLARTIELYDHGEGLINVPAEVFSAGASAIFDYLAASGGDLPRLFDETVGGSVQSYIELQRSLCGFRKDILSAHDTLKRNGTLKE